MNCRRKITDYIRMRCYLQKEEKERRDFNVISHDATEVIPPVNEVLLQSDIDALSGQDHMLDF